MSKDKLKSEYGNLMECIREAKNQLNKASDIVMGDGLQGNPRNYILDRLQVLKKDIQHLIGNVKYKAKEE